MQDEEESHILTCSHMYGNSLVIQLMSTCLIPENVISIILQLASYLG